MLPSGVKTVELRALTDNDKDYEAIERDIKRLFKEEIYLPIIREIGARPKILTNSVEDLLEAIRSGRIQFYRGTFSGRFNATISKELRALGARWERTTGTFKLPLSSLPVQVKMAISSSESNFRAKLRAVDRRLAQILPEKIADRIKLNEHFDSVLWKVEDQFSKSLKKIAIPPKLSPEQTKRLSEEYQNNMKLWIKDWTEKEIANLRKNVQASVFAGNRFDAVIKIIRDSHDVSINKARFLARQETRLLVTKFKQTRYEDAGVSEYRWGISNNPIQPKGAPYVKGMVRHDHGVLAGKVFAWNNPPVVDSNTGKRANPGQDYNCRCYAIPIVRFRETSK